MNTILEKGSVNNKKLLQNIDWDGLGFNAYPTRSMYVATTATNGEWKKGSLVPYGDIKISPAAGVLNYGQGVFEGVKIYRSSKDRIVSFRLENNAIRFHRSCKRICIPPLSTDMFFDAINEVVIDNIDYIPPFGKGSLYVRPVAWGTGPVLGVKPAPSYTFLIFVSPVGPYFKNGVRPLNLKITRAFHRAAPKGIGNAKAIGNYSASLYPRELAIQDGFDEVIYLNASNENLIEEVGSANLFVIKNNVLHTPRLCGSILPGITRDSVLHIAKELLGMKIKETDVSITDLIEADEAFCTGTAVVVTPIGQVTLDDSTYRINKNIGPITKELRKIIQSIQAESKEDKFGWIKQIFP
tara:strand:- start:663 stop:1724 length:1062 start_codon:yes stop_codon:yes gene_type:complete